MLANYGAEVYSSDIDSIYLFSGGRLHKCEGETPESCVCSKVNVCMNCCLIATNHLCVDHTHCTHKCCFMLN